MTKILLIRHGHVEGIHSERFRGREPLALTRRGQAEAEAVAGRISTEWRPACVYTSPMERCVKTADAISQACGMPAAELCEDLNDLDYGVWQFKTFADAETDNQQLFNAWFATPHLVRFPGGESLQDVAARAANALRLIIARHPNQIIVLVGHDSINRTLLLQFLDLPLSSYWRIEQWPCCVNEVDITDGEVRVYRINETYHLVQVD